MPHCHGGTTAQRHHMRQRFVRVGFGLDDRTVRHDLNGNTATSQKGRLAFALRLRHPLTEYCAIMFGVIVAYRGKLLGLGRVKTAHAPRHLDGIDANIGAK